MMNHQSLVAAMPLQAGKAHSFREKSAMIHQNERARSHRHEEARSRGWERKFSRSISHFGSWVDYNQIMNAGSRKQGVLPKYTFLDESLNSMHSQTQHRGCTSVQTVTFPGRFSSGERVGNAISSGHQWPDRRKSLIFRGKLRMAGLA